MSRRELPRGNDGRGGRPPGKLPSARDVAARVIERVLKDSAFASAALDAELARAVELGSRDRALATELVYGSLRTRAALEARIARLAKKLDPKDYVLKSQLLLAGYQLLLLDRVPAHAVVDHAVEAIKRARGPRVAGFVNAVLRRLSSEGKLDAGDAALASLPAWLKTELDAALPEVEVRALVAPSTADGAGPLGIRVRVGVDDGDLPSWLREAPRGKWSSLARRPGSVGDPRRLQGYGDGVFVVQEEGAQVIALAVGAKPGMRVLDACAGRGQKTTLLADQLIADPSSELVACDLHGSKLKALKQELKRLKLPDIETHAVDFSLGTGDLMGGFDRVLVDAPCTGTGTLRRRPEIALRLTAEDPARMAELQASILRHAATLLGAEGRLVYAVCSVLPEECEGVIERVADLLEPVPFEAPDLPWLDAGCCSLRMLPGEHGTDGYFLACLRKRA
ncbi:MAG: Sun protein [Myxococcales bacterium]|nr:Sun protein [Myxococcales bacterium]